MCHLWQRAAAWSVFLVYKPDGIHMLWLPLLFLSFLLHSLSFSLCSSLLFPLLKFSVFVFLSFLMSILAFSIFSWFLGHSEDGERKRRRERKERERRHRREEGEAEERLRRGGKQRGRKGERQRGREEW